MTYLFFIGLVLALMANQFVFLFMQRAGVVGRIVIAAPIVLLLCIVSLWFIGRILSHRTMDLGSAIAWFEITFFSIVSTCVLQAIYARKVNKKLTLPPKNESDNRVH